MLHKNEDWRLSPAFDLVPNVGFNREHVLLIGYDNRPPDLETLLQEARHFGLKRREQILKVIVEVHEVVSEWSTVFTECNVPERDAESIGKDKIAARRDCHARLSYQEKPGRNSLYSVSFWGSSSQYFDQRHTRPGRPNTGIQGLCG